MSLDRPQYMKGRSVRAAYALLAVAAACGGSPTATVNSDAPTSFSFAGRAPSTLSVTTPSHASADTLRWGYDQLIVTRARLVLQQMTIGTSSGVDCSSDAANDRCRSLMAGPSVVDLPLGASAEQRFALEVPAGAYAQVALALVASPELGGNSIRVEGTWNGTPFIYEANLELARALVLPRPVLIGLSGTATNVTVSVPVTSWFRADDGTLVNPARAKRGSPRDAEIRAGISKSLRAFEDRDRDGDERSG